LRRGNDGLMAAMNTVEIADGDHRATQSVIGRKPAHDVEVFRRHPAFAG
jgi:hypothetical protein